MSNITINPPHSGRPNILLEDDQDVELMLAEMQVSDNIRGAGLQTHASDVLMNIDDQIDQSEAAASRLSDFFNRIDRIVSELSNVRTSLIALVQSSFFDTIRLRIQTRSIDLGDANPNPIVGQTTSRSMMISLSPDPTITDGRLPHVAVPTLSSTSEDRRVPYTKYAELVPGSLEIAFKHSISALDKDCDNIKHLDDALRFSDLLTLANGSRPAPIPTHANISGYSPQVIKCNSFEGKFYYSVTDEDDCYRYHNERNSCISLIKAMLNEDMLHYLQLSISANDATGTYLKLHEFFNSKKLCKNKTCKYVHKLMTDQEKRDCGYDEDRKDSTRIAKINNNNKMKNGMNNNSLGKNGMHNANYDTAVPLTHEHCMAIGNPRAKTTDKNPNGSFFEGQKHHHIKSAHIALNNFKFGGDIEKDISNLRELITILEKAQGSLLTESTKFVVLGKSMTFEKGTPITYALKIILKLWNNISSNKNTAEMAAVSLKSEERICFRFNQGLCKNKTCKYVHKLMTDQQKKDCGYDEDRKDSTRIAKINNNNKMKNDMNNNSLGTNGMHNANYDTAVPLTHEHCMAIGIPRAKITEKNPLGLSKIQLSQMKSIFIFENKKSIQGRNNNNNNGQSEPWGHNCKKSSATIESLAPKSFFQAILNPLWRTSILKELDNLCGNSCFRWIPDIGQHRLLMMWLFYCKSNYDRKARIVMDGSKCIPCDAVEAVEFASITNRYAQFHHGTYETKYSVRTEPAIQVLQKSRATSQGGRVMLGRVVRVQ